MKIDIGILAHNEEDGISDTIESMSKQNIFSNGHEILIHCIVNGSSDKTAEKAEVAFENHFSSLVGVKYKVIEIPRPGKSAAWNDFIHQYSCKDSQVIFLADADICFDNINSLSLMLNTLVMNPEASVCVDMPIKKINHQNASTRLSKNAGELSNIGPAKICGQLYCGRSSSLRAIVLPAGLMVEDGFLRACITTANFTSHENNDRVIRADGASHLFDPFTKLPDLFAHERRIVYGTAVNAVLFGYLRNKTASGYKISTIITKNNNNDKDWVRKLARKDFYKVLHVPLTFVILPYFQIFKRPINSWINSLAAASTRSIFSIAIAAAVFMDLLKGRAKW